MSEDFTARMFRTVVNGNLFAYSYFLSQSNQPCKNDWQQISVKHYCGEIWQICSVCSKKGSQLQGLSKEHQFPLK